MTKTLQEAFDAISRLPEPEQDRLAAAILEEIAVAERWESALAQSQDALERLADEALAERGGPTAS